MNSSLVGAATWRSGLLVFVALDLCSSIHAQFQNGGPEAYDVRRDPTVVAVEHVMPSVVNIATKEIVPVSDPFEQAVREWTNRRQYDERYSLGSGVVIDEAGYLLTNEHVVSRASEIAVKFATGGDVYSATVVASDPKSDVALLKINSRPGEKFHAIKLAREDDLLLGETVLALGNPLGLGGSVTRGILSSKSRRPPKEGEPLVIADCLQTDAAINPGNSGGPLVNMRGELIGINDQYVPGAQSIGFAIPIRRVLEALSEKMPTEFIKSYWFGARVKVGSYPLVITFVQPESPAGKAGLRVGDVVMQVNGKVPKNFIDFGELLATNVTRQITFTVRRDADLKELTLQLVPQENVFNADMVRRKLGIGIEPRHLRLLGRNVKVFVITLVEKNSPADEAGLKNGMFITAVDGELPESPTEFAKYLSAKPAGESVQISLLSSEQQGDLILSLQSGTVELTPR